MKFRINNRFHKALRTRSFTIERDRLGAYDTETIPLGFLEYDSCGGTFSIKSQKNFILFPAPSTPDIKQNQPYMVDFDYRIQVSPSLRIACPNTLTLDPREGISPRPDWKTPTSSGYYNWLTDDASNPYKYFTEVLLYIADRFVECPNTQEEHKYRILKTETIGTVQDIYLHDITTTK